MGCSLNVAWSQEQGHLPREGSPPAESPLTWLNPDRCRWSRGSFLPALSQPLPYGRRSGWVQISPLWGRHSDQGVNSVPSSGGTGVISPPKGPSSDSPLYICLQRRHEQPVTLTHTSMSSGPCFFFAPPSVSGKLLSSELLCTGAIATPHRALRGRLSGAHSVVARGLDGSVNVARAGGCGRICL